ncbi:hypothetical protein BC828DRAFT_434218 [Blastocladiella britannica]|nr:hypothetical protein BC828DRAFT_434218 [Blastocladiella britannica]
MLAKSWAGPTHQIGAAASWPVLGLDACSKNVHGTKKSPGLYYYRWTWGDPFLVLWMAVWVCCDFIVKQIGEYNKLNVHTMQSVRDTESCSQKPFQYQSKLHKSKTAPFGFLTYSLLGVGWVARSDCEISLLDSANVLLVILMSDGTSMGSNSVILGGNVTGMGSSLVVSLASTRADTGSGLVSVLAGGMVGRSGHLMTDLASDGTGSGSDLLGMHSSLYPQQDLVVDSSSVVFLLLGGILELGAKLAKLITYPGIEHGQFDVQVQWGAQGLWLQVQKGARGK